ncbi:MAG: hypothetical protein ACYS0K_13345 [Planctomycetota bacterium]|jgi:hypothetical protein
MRRICVLLLLSATAVYAQESMTAGDALNQETCAAMAEQVKARIEAYTRMKFRRHVPIGVEPRASWDARLKQQGMGGRMARSGLAFYNIIANAITVVPWTIGGYLGKKPGKRTRAQWLGALEPIMVHELTHAIHHQNFYVILGGARSASLRTDGLTDEEIDVSTVEFLTAEGYAELVALRTATPIGRGHLLRIPASELSHPRHYMRHYRPNGKTAFRATLSASGYQDGVDMLNKLTMSAGPRGVRAVLYRQPPRVLFFQPELLAKVELSDPPEPDAVLGFLSPFFLEGGEVHLTVNPGPHRYFLNARQGRMRARAPGCLIGYAAEVGEDEGPHGAGRYSFFVADPDRPGKWAEEQTATLKALNPSGVKEAKRPIPETKKKAKVTTVKAEDGSLYMRAESEGLVVMAHESKPTDHLEKRVLLALAYLHLYKPKPGIYAEMTAEAKKRLAADD